jgi:hypothetical protein
MAHAFNPSYSGSRDQEHCSLKPTPSKEKALNSNPSTEKIKTLQDTYKFIYNFF